MIEAILGPENTEIPVPKPDDDPDEKPDEKPNDTPEDPSVFSVSLDQNHVNAATLGIVVTVTCDQEWTAVLTDGSWGTLGEPETGEDNVSTFTIQLGFNPSEEARNNTLIVRSGNKEMRSPFSQGGTASFFSPGTLQLRGTQEGTVEFATGLDWTASAQEDWLQLLQAGGKGGETGVLRVAAKEEYVDLGQRSGSITVLFGGTYPLTLPVIQYQKDVVILSSPSVALDYTAQAFTVETDSNVDYSIRADAGWIHPDQTPRTRSLNHGVEGFTVEENPEREPRTGTVTFTGQTAEGTPVESVFTVTQEARHPFLWNTRCGIYQLNGTDVICYPNAWQTAVLKLPDGTFYFRLMNPESLSVHVLAGIPQTLSAGDRVSFTHLFYQETAEPKSSQAFTCTVIKVGDTLLWMQDDNGTGFVVKH